MKRHLSTNIRGLIRNGSAIKQIAKDKGCNPKQVKLYLENLLDKGESLLKDDQCDNFDPNRGCLGHEEG